MVSYPKAESLKFISIHPFIPTFLSHKGNNAMTASLSTRSNRDYDA